MKPIFLLTCCIALCVSCRRQLVLQRSDVNWYPGNTRNYTGPPSVQIRLINGHGRPLAGHNIHLDEVNVNTTSAKTPSTLLGWAPIQRNAAGGITLVTDDRGAARIAFETPPTFAPGDLGVHWLRFNHTRRHGRSKSGKGVTCIVPVALCQGNDSLPTPPCYSDPTPTLSTKSTPDTTQRPTDPPPRKVK